MKLREYLDDREIPSHRFAKAILISEGHLSNLMAGRRKPSLQLAQRINELTDGCVGLGDWAEK